MLVFEEGGETGVPEEKPLGAEKRTNNKLNPHMTPGLGIEPGTHWWEASVLTTAPPLLPICENISRNGALGIGGYIHIRIMVSLLCPSI